MNTEARNQSSAASADALARAAAAARARLLDGLDVPKEELALGVDPGLLRRFSDALEAVGVAARAASEKRRS